MTVTELFDYYFLVELAYSWACECYLNGPMIP